METDPRRGQGLSFEACAALVERGDPDRFRATMAAPLEARRVLFPLYAFNIEVTRTPWVTQEAMIAEMRLQWWRDALEEIGQGGPVRKHEVVDELAKILDQDACAQLDALVAARRWDIYSDPFEDAAHFDDYIHATSSNLMTVAVNALGAADQEAVRLVGFASGIANFFRAIPALQEAGRKPLVDGRAVAVRTLAERGLECLKRARSMKQGISKAAAPALSPAFLAKPTLEQALKSPELVADGGLGLGPARESLRFAHVSLWGWWR